MIKLVGDGLELAGFDVPVVEPGSPLTTLPAVVLIPDDDELTFGNRSLRHGLELVVVVPRISGVANYQRLQEITRVVLRSLIPSSVAFAGPIRPGSTGGPDTGEPPGYGRFIPVTFPGDVDLC